MECYEYQKFVQVFNIFRDENKIPHTRTFPKNFVFNKDSEYYAEFGNSMKLRIGLDLERCVVHEIDDRTKRALLMTSIPKKKDILSNLRLPYPAIFLDCAVDDSDEEIGYGKRITGLLISEQEVKEGDWLFNVFFVMESGDGLSIEHFKISFTDISKVMQYADNTSKVKDILKRLIVNTILFITDPEVEMVFRVRGEKNRKRRVEQGKLPLPDSRVVRLTGKLKQYFDTYGHNFDGRGYSCKFDVHGFWRHFKSEKYKRLQNMKQGELSKYGYVLRGGYVCKWIPPFKKGQGVYIKKVYSLEKPLEEGEIDFQSIKPLNKPLKEMR